MGIIESFSEFVNYTLGIDWAAFVLVMYTGTRALWTLFLKKGINIGARFAQTIVFVLLASGYWEIMAVASQYEYDFARQPMLPLVDDFFQIAIFYAVILVVVTMVDMMRKQMVTFMFGIVMTFAALVVILGMADMAGNELLASGRDMAWLATLVMAVLFLLFLPKLRSIQRHA